MNLGPLSIPIAPFFGSGFVGLAVARLCAEDCEQPVVMFDYQPGRGQEYPQAFLAGYDGMLMTDRYSAWRTLEGVTHFGCLAHARRAFVDALKGHRAGCVSSIACRCSRPSRHGWTSNREGRRVEYAVAL